MAECSSSLILLKRRVVSGTVAHPDRISSTIFAMPAFSSAAGLAVFWDYLFFMNVSSTAAPHYCLS
jgi:hypothetical protein